MAASTQTPHTALRSAPTGEQYAPLPDKKNDGFVTAHAVQTILADAESLFALWNDLTSIPLWQERVVSVTPLDSKRSHWVMGDTDDPNSKHIEFDSETVELIPGRKIAWRTVDGEAPGTRPASTSGSTTVAGDHNNNSVTQGGEVHFEPGRIEGSTLVTLIQTVKVPGGRLGNALAATGERGPKQLVIENLRHFKQLAETGEIPSVKDQPHGPRGISGGFKRWLHGETNPTPPGTSEPTLPSGKDGDSVSKP